MAEPFLKRLKHAWNAFINNKDPTPKYVDLGSSYYYRPDRQRFTGGNERTIVTSVYNRIALDAAAVEIKHVRLDKNDRYLETIDSGINYCLNIEANIDQTGRAFVQDVVMSMLDEGCVAIVPVDTTTNPTNNNSYDIKTLRTGKILQWYPNHVQVRVYNERTGNKEDIILPKSMVAIIENPLYAVINEPNSTMQRLIRKLSLLDAIDEQSSAGKLDLIIQLPYTIKTEARRQQAEMRRKEIEMQLTGSKYGIAYTDGTEHITQLNRPIENNLMKQIEYLTSMLYSQLGITQAILDGTADERTMLNYYSRSIEPIVSAIVDELKRKFLTKTARSQSQSFLFFRDPFKLVPINDIANIADTFTRNEILSSNEIRQLIGIKPSSDPKADQLRNSNINQTEENNVQAQEENSEYYDYGNYENYEY
ncbi:MAG: phage portal protein [Anaeroplasma sp.]